MSDTKENSGGLVSFISILCIIAFFGGILLMISSCFSGSVALAVNGLSCMLIVLTCMLVDVDLTIESGFQNLTKATQGQSPAKPPVEEEDVLSNFDS